MIRILRALRHVRWTILRPSVQRYQEMTVSRHVGTQGFTDALTDPDIAFELDELETFFNRKH